VLLFGLLALSASLVFAQSSDQLAPTLSSAHHGFTVFAPRGHRSGPFGSSSSRPTSAGIDSLKNFNGEFRAPGVGPSGNPQRNWHYTIAGSRPELGGTTTFDAPIVPVSLDLLDYDGSVRAVNL